MKFSLNWIRQYTDLPSGLTLSRLSHDLTMRTVEVEGAVNPAADLEQIVAAEILAVDPHPKADRLSVCSVNIGRPDPVTIVCGGINLAVGQTVAVALPGSKVRWHGEGEPVEIKAAKLRGVSSHGMICASSELSLEALFPASDEREIMDLRGMEAKPGQPLAEVLDLDDLILEIDNKSMTNRPDLWGHYGMARELAAIYQTALRPLPVLEVPADTPAFPVAIDSPDHCSRYAAVVYQGLRNGESPYWLRLTLWKVGIRPLSCLVDITNYVMLATGQPTHGFDRRAVRREIRVRTARDQEKLLLLDGHRLELDPDDLVICDAEKPMALAGIMGGRDDGLLPETEEMILELANFNPLTVRRSARRHGIRTEAGNRNEKGIDAARMDQAMGVADQLIRRLMPEAAVAAYTDCVARQPEHPVIEVSLRFLATRLGREITSADISSSLEPLGFSIETRQSGNDTIFLCHVPAWRATGDVSLPEDILEEVARMIGYENFTLIPPAVTLEKAISQRDAETDRAIREYLAFHAGFQEIYTYPWIDDLYIDAAGIQLSECLELATPPSPSAGHLRASLIPGLLQAVAENERYLETFRMFEAAQVFQHGETHPSDSEEALPLQTLQLGLAMAGDDPVRLFRQVKGVLEQMPRIVQVEPWSFARQQQPAWADHKAWLNLLSEDGQIIGSFGLLSARAARAADIRHSLTALAELNLDALRPLPSRENRYQRLPQFPQVEQDLSIVIDSGVAWQSIADLIAGLVRRSEFIEEYHGAQVPEGKKSLMFRVWLGSDEGTLTADAVEAKMKKILKMIRQTLGGEIRQAGQ